MRSSHEPSKRFDCQHLYSWHATTIAYVGCWRDVSDRLQQSFVVEPINPFHTQAHAVHQTLYRATGYCDLFAVQLSPNFASSVDLVIVMPHLLDAIA